MHCIEHRGQAIHAGTAHHLDEMPTNDPIGFCSLPGPESSSREVLRDDPALRSGLVLCELLPWHVADA